MAKKYLKDFYWKDYVIITIGLILYSVGLIGFIKPSGIVTGGLAGIALLTEYATNNKIPMQVTYFVVNCFLLLISIKTLGIKFLVKTIYGVITLTFLLTIARMIITQPLIQEEPILSGVIGAIMCGFGIGMVFSVNGSTGGTDIIIAVINKFKNISFGRAMMIIDFLIICLSFLLPKAYFMLENPNKVITPEDLLQLKLNKIVIGVIVMFVMTYTIDFVINGFKQSVQFLIFSDKYDTIANAINKEMKRGCTVLDGTGWYSKKQVKVIVLLAKRNESVNIYRMIKNIDENAFISQSNVQGVYGQGFDAIKH